MHICTSFYEAYDIEMRVSGSIWFYETEPTDQFLVVIYFFFFIQPRSWFFQKFLIGWGFNRADEVWVVQNHDDGALFEDNIIITLIICSFEWFFKFLSSFSARCSTFAPEMNHWNIRFQPVFYYFSNSKFYKFPVFELRIWTCRTQLWDSASGAAWIYPFG